MSASDPVTAVANALGDGLILTAQVEAQKNTQADIYAAVAAVIQKHNEQIMTALEKGDLDAIRILCAAP